VFTIAEHTDPPGSPPPPGTFRERALQAFTKLLGEPKHVPVDSGTIYRWRLPRKGRHNVNVYITIDAPELPEFAHVMVSDPSATQGEPVRSFMIRGADEFEAVEAYLRAIVDAQG
jgi:hypothetical protein